jgi:hypothetical protein
LNDTLLGGGQRTAWFTVAMCQDLGAPVSFLAVYSAADASESTAHGGRDEHDTQPAGEQAEADEFASPFGAG